MKITKCLIRQTRSSALSLLTILLLLAGTSNAQPENSNWAFGYNGGLNFSVYGVTATKGHTGHYEGSASISDQNGQLLFSTDGQRVMDRTGAVMPNGMGLKGQHSSTQAALIVPFPGTNCRKYIIFSVPTVVNTVVANRNLYYSVVDMSLNGGMGDVTSVKNVLLQTRVAEKIAGVVGTPGGFYVVAHGYDETSLNDPINRTYFVSKITSTGVTNLANTANTMTPFSVGNAHAVCPGLNPGVAPGEGQMKISPNRQWIASAVGVGFVEVVRFNPNNGNVSNPSTIKFSACQPSPYFASYGAYGVEFSRDSLSLYATTSGNSNSELVKITNFASSPQSSTRVFPATFPNPVSFGALQMGPDQRIYAARDGEMRLGVINSTGSYNDNGATLLNATKSQWGLPSLVVGNNWRFPNCCTARVEGDQHGPLSSPQ